MGAAVIRTDLRYSDFCLFSTGNYCILQICGVADAALEQKIFEGKIGFFGSRLTALAADGTAFGFRPGFDVKEYIVRFEQCNVTGQPLAFILPVFSEIRRADQERPFAAEAGKFFLLLFRQGAFHLFYCRKIEYEFHIFLPGFFKEAQHFRSVAAGTVQGERADSVETQPPPGIEEIGPEPLGIFAYPRQTDVQFFKGFEFGEIQNLTTERTFELLLAVNKGGNDALVGNSGTAAAQHNIYCAVMGIVSVDRPGVLDQTIGEIFFLPDIFAVFKFHRLGQSQLQFNFAFALIGGAQISKFKELLKSLSL